MNLTVQGKIALASIGEQTVLVYEGSNHTLYSTTYNTTSKSWSEALSLKVETKGSIALTSFKDAGNGKEALMLCWVSANGFIESMTFGGDASSMSWSNVVPVNQLTDGDMSLGQVGASLFLVYKERNTRKMRVTSHSTIQCIQCGRFSKQSRCYS